MAMMVTMQVGPVDWSKFRAAMAWANQSEAPGRHWTHVYKGESDANTAFVVEEWDSHDAMHAYQEKLGDEFNRRAGTDGLQWTTATWQLVE